jgi:hypothetical protein
MVSRSILVQILLKVDPNHHLFIATLHHRKLFAILTNHNVWYPLVLTPFSQRCCRADRIFLDNLRQVMVPV